jgi:leader peptidase (prepilin peptidase)/N-methyltransferase
MNRSRGIDIEEVAFGFGDVRLAGVVGLLLGWRVLPVSLYITIVLGALGALTYIIIRKLAGHKYAAFSAIPYGPYIVAAAIMVLLFPEQIGLWLLGGR